MKRNKCKLIFIVLVFIGAGMLLTAYLVGAFDNIFLCGGLDPRQKWSRRYDIWPQVYSQNGPDFSSWEYKVNCGSDDGCFLSDLPAVNVITPANEVIPLDRDFNTNSFSGEVTRRWVKNGP